MQYLIPLAVAVHFYLEKNAYKHHRYDVKQRKHLEKLCRPISFIKKGTTNSLKTCNGL